MPPEFHRRVRTLFEEALELPEAERLSFLNIACARDTVTLDAVVHLLAAHAAAPQSFLLENRISGLRRIDRYIIVGELGRGAMGIVYEATDPRFSRNVAVKVIHPQLLATPAEAKLMRERLFREARAAGALSHPGLVTIFDAGQEGGLAFIVMEQVEGPSLQKILASDRELDRSRTLDILRQAGAALDYAHRNGVVHRDVKPANIMLHRDSTVKLTDFGIAKVLSAQSHTHTAQSMGTPTYMSPEQIEGRTVDGRSDQFSLGVIAYEMLTGSRPFQADSVAALAHWIVYGPRPSASAANPALPAPIDNILDRGLSRLPGDRYAGCAEFVTALEGALSDAYEQAPRAPAGAPAEPPSPKASTSQIPRHSTRMPLSYLVGALAALLLVLAVLLLARSSKHAVQTAPPVVAFGGDSDPHWQRQLIQNVVDGKITTWPYVWKDIFWDGQEGWLCGEVVSDGGIDNYGVRHAGRGVLVHTTNQGVSWARVDEAKFHSGQGGFPWGPRGTYKWTWQEIGPIGAIRVYTRGPIAPDKVWLAATTGVYYSGDGGRTWRRSTPRPDDPKHAEIYAHFGNLFLIADPEEIFAVGWQGISHWSSANRAWQLQLPTYSYPISAVYAYPSSPRQDVWAVGHSGSGDSRGLIYHLRQPDNVWEALTVTGLGLDSAKGSLQDILLIDGRTGFAVGPQGVIVKGSKNNDGVWSWARLGHPPVTADLNSIVYVYHTDHTDQALWIVGSEGTVLSSRDLGLTWSVSHLRDENGDLPNLSRIRAFGHSLWIAGNGVVYMRHL